MPKPRVVSVFARPKDIRPLVCFLIRFGHWWEGYNVCAPHGGKCALGIWATGSFLATKTSSSGLSSIKQ